MCAAGVSPRQHQFFSPMFHVIYGADLVWRLIIIRLKYVQVLFEQRMVYGSCKAAACEMSTIQWAVRRHDTPG